MNDEALVPVDAEFYDSVGEDLVPASGFVKTPWVGFFGSKTKKNRETLVAAGIAENQFYLFDSEALAVKPFQFHLIKAKRFYTKQDRDGNTVATLLERPDKEQYAAGFREHLMTLVAVVKRDPLGKPALIPATMGARSGLAKVFRTAIDLTRPGGSAAEPGSWASRGDKHAIAANSPFPGGRFLVTAWGTTEETLDGENEYNLGHSTIAPTSAEGVMALKALFSADGIKEILVPATVAWESRCKGLAKLVK